MPFLNGEGILVATRATMAEGLSLSKVTHLVLYDIPHDKISYRKYWAGSIASAEPNN